MSEEPYFVEVDRIGCSSCGKGTTWTVIGPQGSQHSESWGSEEEAANFAECMNEAYANGRAASLSPKIPAAEPESRSCASGEESPVFSRSDIREMYENVKRRFSQREPFCDAWGEPLRVVFEVVLGPMDPSTAREIRMRNNLDFAAELRAAIDEVGRIPHLNPPCTRYKSERLAILRARLDQLEKKAEEKP